MQAGEKEGAANAAEQEKDGNCLKALRGQENPEERDGYRNRGARELLVAEQKQPSATHGGRRGVEGGGEGRKEGQGDARQPGLASSRLLSLPRQRFLAAKSFVRRKHCGCAGAFEEKSPLLSQLSSLPSSLILCKPTQQ